ncbi:MAG TPA: hypothetical protein VG733_19300 [Chthoniobacteraceae bacterium]|nr:hypothetical protein [Chthoniobacteraceae bacterium]
MDPHEQLTRLEKELLFSADEDGFIPFPEGNACQVSLKMQALGVLEIRGLVRRRSRVNALIRGYQLTDAGAKLKARLASPFSDGVMGSERC